ncbi:CvpA family protein [Pediococcus acidilactici]|uniref:CvpA family protein n=1 Tax=Pediococcus acidilactici TaxID=1254 RepID=UPI0013278C99|nr:CvpA family protein [Pediococcus acidilactici]KAF0415636.1 CvpA family protein [Pediococcus acidilactici]
MLLSLILILILISAFFFGYRRGLVAEIIYLVGYLIVFTAAKNFTAPFAEFLSRTFGNGSHDPLTNLTTMNAVSFIFLMLVGWIVIRLIVRFSQMITWLPVIHQVNGLAGAVAGFVISYLITFIVLSISQFVPNDFYQEQLSQSIVAQSILAKTPAISSKVINNYILDTPQTRDVL